MDQIMKLDRLMQKIEAFANRLERNREFNVHQNINHFYYMQKVTELTVLREQFTETQQRLSFLRSRIESEYGCVSTQWLRDVRWLHYYEMNLRG